MTESNPLRTDASRFGQSYLEKFGWDTSKGLGASGEGRTNAIKMSQKLDMLGIGMQRHQNDPDGISWRQNRDFENLLQRLNEGTEAIGPFHKARECSPSEGEEVAAEAVDSAHDPDEGADEDATKREKKKKKQKKRKALQEEDEDEEEPARDKRERKKRKKSKNDVPSAVPASPSLEAQAVGAPSSESTPVPSAPIAAPAPIRALYVVHLHVRLSTRAHGTYFLLPYEQSTRPPRPHHRSQAHGCVQLHRARRNPRHPVLLIFHYRHRFSISAHHCHYHRHNDPDPDSRYYVRRSRRSLAAKTNDGHAVGWRLFQGETWRQSSCAAPVDRSLCHSGRG
jgi:hypothetical protein